jgi:hypothetical protein
VLIRTCPRINVYLSEDFVSLVPFWILPRRLKAAAGSLPDPGGYDYDPDTEVISIPANTKVKDSVRLFSACSGSDALKYRDPLHLLLDYIAEVVILAWSLVFDLIIRPILTSNNAAGI